MKYILLDDFKYLFTKLIKYILLYFIIMNCFLIFNYVSGEEINFELLVNSIGLNAGNKPFMNLIVFGFHTAFFCYIAISLFIKDISSQSNLLLRMKINNYYLYKLLSILFIIFLLESISYLIYFILILIFYNDMLLTFKLYTINLLFIFGVVVYLINSYICRFNFILGLVLIYFIYNVHYLIVDINIFFLIIWIIINILLGYFLVRKYRYNIFQKK